MAAISVAFEQTFRDFVLEGVPSSGPNNTFKSEARELGAVIETAISSIGATNLADYQHETKAEADTAASGYTDGEYVLVWGDSTDSNNDLWLVDTGALVQTGTNGIFHDIIANLAQGYTSRAQNSVPFETWADLEAAVNMEDGDRATVEGAGDTDDHTDPVTALTVLDNGRYEYVDPTGWERVANLDSQDAEAAAASLAGLGDNIDENIASEVFYTLDPDATSLVIVDNDYVIVGSDEGSGGSTDAEVIAARGSADNLNERLSYQLASTGYSPGVFHNLDNLRDWPWLLLRAKRSEALAIHTTLADSWTARYGPGYTEVWTAQMKDAYGDGGEGWYPSYVSARTASGLSCSQTGTWTNTEITGNGPDLKQATSSTAGDQIVKAIPADHTYHTTFFLKQSGGGTFRYSTDGGSTWVETVDTSDTSDSLGTVEIASVPSGAYSFVVEVVSGTVTHLGDDLRKDYGFLHHKLAQSGSVATDWSTASDVAKAAWAELDVATLQIGPLGTNDAGNSVNTKTTFKTAYETLISDWRTIRPTMDIVLAASPATFFTEAVSISVYNEAVLELAYDADLRLAAFDIQRKWGDKTEYGAGTVREFVNEGVDDKHPTLNGYRSLAALMIEIYSRGAI